MRISSYDERFFAEKRTNLKYKKGNRFYTIHRRDYKRKSYPNPHTTPFFILALGQVMLNLL